MKERPESSTSYGDETERKIPTFCSMCGPTMGCGIYCYVKDGKLVRIEGMAESPRNRGKLCPRAFASMQWLYSPQRLKFPLKRVGKKGEGKFEKISWDEAIEIIAGKLLEQKEKYGPESLAILSPARRSYSDYLYRFLIAHGSPNYGHSGICAIQRAFGLAYTLGTSRTTPDYGRSDLIIIWGANPVYSGTPQGPLKRILDAQARGAKLVVIKPEMQPDAAKADIWAPIRPGTDGALALATLNVIVNEHLVDEDFVDRWCYGFDRLVPHIQKYTPEWASQITGLPIEQIVGLARLYATTKAACINMGNAFDQTVDSNNGVRSVAILMAVTGHLDAPGGNIISAASSTMPHIKSVHLRHRYTQEMVDKLVGPEIPTCFQPFIEGTSSAYYRCFDSVLTERPYPVRAIIAPGTQPTVITRGPSRVVEALNKLEFFVVLDVMQNAAMPWADVVIPIATMYESDHPFEGGMNNWLMARNKVVERMGDYKSDYEFWLDLAVRMGYGKDFWDGSIERCMDYQLENFGITMEELRRHTTGIIYETRPSQLGNFEKVFSARSPRLSGAPYLPQGKVAIYNTTFEENGFSPLPEWVGPPESPSTTPALLDRYPLTFTDHHTSDVYNAGWLRNVSYLREVQPEPWLHINPETARARGIEDGDWVIVESPHGSIRLMAVYFPGIRPDTVTGLQGWWQGCNELGSPDTPLLDGSASTNCLYSIDPEKAFDPLVTGMPKQTLVEVRKGISGRRQSGRRKTMMGGQHGFLFDADRCVMCHACELACKGTRGLELGINWRKVIEIWRNEYPDVSRTFVSLSCLHCEHPPCEQACPTGAISKRSEDGVVLVDKGICTGCQECYAACPHGVPQFGMEGTMQKCDLCLERGMQPACTEPCPAEALFFGSLEECARMAENKGGYRLPGAHGPALFVVNRRGPPIAESEFTMGKNGQSV